MIKHDGKNMPCSSEIKVLVRLRHGGVTMGCARKYIWNWEKTPYRGDVIEYQIMP